MFSQDPFFDAEPPESAFMMTLNSILESVWEQSLLIHCFLVAPVIEIVDIL